MLPFMKTAHHRLVTAALLLFMGSSCTNIKNDQTRTRVEGGLAGTLLGAGVGAIIGNQSGNAGRGALIGAAAGGLAGLAVGDAVARKKAAYAREEARLDAAIEAAREANARARAYNNQLSGRLARLERQAAAARASGDRAELAQVGAAIKLEQREARSQLNTLDGQINTQKSTLDGASDSDRAAKLRQEISGMQSTRTSLKTSSDRLASLANSVDA